MESSFNQMSFNQESPLLNWKCVLCSQVNQLINLTCINCGIKAKRKDYELFYQRCMKCKKLNEKNFQISSFCDRCGWPLDQKQVLQYSELFDLKMCPTCRFQNSKQNVICRNCDSTLIEQDLFQCPFCSLYISNHQIEEHVDSCQQSTEVIQELKTLAQMPKDEFKCTYCCQVFQINKCCFTLACDHQVCSLCLCADLETKIEKGLVYQAVCKVCNLEIDYNIIKGIVSEKHFTIYTDLVHKNLKTSDKHLILKPCRGLTTQLCGRLPESDSIEKFEALCNYFHRNPEERVKSKNIQQCQAILSYHKLEDEDVEFYHCITCNLKMCINGCQSLHRGMSCTKYNQQELIFNSFMNYFGLNEVELDERGNRNYIKSDITIKKMINNEPYYVPHGFRQYGINLKGKYKENEWLGKGPNAWVVMYHGVRHAHCNIDNRRGKTILQNILQNNLQPGSRQLYKKQACVRTGKLIGIGVYGSPFISVCSDGYAGYSTKVEGVNYCVIIKCRVRPAAIRVCRKVSDIGRLEPEYQNDYWVINQPADIRPYAILLKRT